MGLISQLEPTALEKKLQPSQQVAKPFAEVTDVPALTPPGRDPIPCEICRSPFFWADHFGVIRCCDCSPSPSRSLVRWPLFGLAGPPGGPWWWETLEDEPRVFGRPGGASGAGQCDEAGDGDQDGRDGRRIIEHTFHGHTLLTVIGSGSVAEQRDKWQKCATWCWPDETDEIARKETP